MYSTIVEDSQALVDRIAAGDRAAETELIERYERSIRMILLKRTGKPQLANDLCQDTFVIILRKLRAGELKQPKNLSGFIHRVAINLSIQHFRKEKRYVYSEGEIFGSKVAFNEQKAEKLDQLTLRDMLEDVMDQLTVKRDREVLRRFYLSDDDKQIICSALQISSAHFDRVLYRAKQRMRHLINEQKGLKAVLFGGLLDE